MKKYTLYKKNTNFNLTSIRGMRKLQKNGLGGNNINKPKPTLLKSQNNPYADKYRGFPPDKNTTDPEGNKIKHPEVSHINIQAKRVIGFVTTAETTPEGEPQFFISNKTFDGKEQMQYFATYALSFAYLDEDDIKIKENLNTYFDQTHVEENIARCRFKKYSRYSCT